MTHSAAICPKTSRRIQTNARFFQSKSNKTVPEIKADGFTNLSMQRSCFRISFLSQSLRNRVAIQFFAILSALLKTTKLRAITKLKGNCAPSVNSLGVLLPVENLARGHSHSSRRHCRRRPSARCPLHQSSLPRPRSASFSSNPQSQ